MMAGYHDQRNAVSIYSGRVFRDTSVFLQSRKDQHTSRTGEPATRDDEELRKVKEQANKLEIENAVKLYELLPVEEVADFYYTIAVVFGSQLDALAGRLSGQLPGDAAENRKLIFGEARAIRSATAEELKKEAVRIIAARDNERKIK